MSTHRSDADPPKPIPPQDTSPADPNDPPKDLPPAPAAGPDEPVKDPNSGTQEAVPTTSGSPALVGFAAPQAPGPRSARTESHPNAGADDGAGGAGDFQAPQAPGPEPTDAP